MSSSGIFNYFGVLSGLSAAIVMPIFFSESFSESSSLLCWVLF